MCGEVAAPGCNNKNCAAPVDSGLTFDSGLLFDTGAPSDAGARDGGHDASHSPEGGDGFVCGGKNDAGIEQFGSCTGTQQCCQGGTPDSFYCYAGDGGCPALP